VTPAGIHTLVVDSNSTFLNNVVIGDGNATDVLNANCDTYFGGNNFHIRPSIAETAGVLDHPIGNGMMMGFNRVSSSGTNSILCNGYGSQGGLEVCNYDVSDVLQNIPAHFRRDGSTDLNGDVRVGGDLAVTGTTTGITKAMVSLGNCDDTADSAKPISVLQQAALDLKSDDNAVLHLACGENVTGYLKVGTAATGAIPAGTLYASEGLSVLGSVSLPNQSVSNGALQSSAIIASNANTFTQKQTLNGGLQVTGTLTLENQAIDDGALSTNVVLKSTANTYTNTQTFESGVSSSVITGGYLSCNTLVNGVALEETFNTNPDSGGSKLWDLTIRNSFHAKDFECDGPVIKTNGAYGQDPATEITGNLVVSNIVGIFTDLYSSSDLNVIGSFSSISTTTQALSLIDAELVKGDITGVNLLDAVDLTFTGTINTVVTPAEVLTLSGVSSNIQTQIGLKSN
jgi:hypothetical protein